MFSENGRKMLSAFPLYPLWCVIRRDFFSFFSLSLLVTLFLFIVCKTTDQKPVRRLCRLKSALEKYTWIIGLCSFSQKVNLLFSLKKCVENSKSAWKKKRTKSTTICFSTFMSSQKFTYRKKSLLDIKLCKRWRKKKKKKKKNTIVQCTRCWRVYKHLDLDSVSMILCWCGSYFSSIRLLNSKS